MYKRFCLVFLSLSLALAVLTAAFAMLADPYEVWGICRRVGFNMSSPKAEEVERLHKPLAFLRLEVQPETVFMGTSQVLYAMDMDAYKEMTGKSAFNFGVRGATIYEQGKVLEHVLASDKRVRDIYLNLDFYSFLEGEYLHPAKFSKTFLKYEAQYGVPYITPESFLQTVFSWDALTDSKDKIKANYKKHWQHPYYMASGKAYEDNLLDFFQRDHWRFTRSLSMMDRDGNYREARLDPECLAELRRMAEMCRERGIELHLFIAPIHARHMEIFAEIWPVYEEWLRALVQVAPVTDFCGYNEITMSEAKPGLVDEETNPYFWDVIHMKTSLGNRVLRGLLGDREALAGFGTVLNQDNVESHIRGMARGRAAWEAAHPESPEETLYYGRFSPRPPRDLQGLGATQERSLIRVDYVSKDYLENRSHWRNRPVLAFKTLPFDMELSREERLLLHCCRLSTPGEPRAVYAVLEHGAGQRLYAMAELADSKAASDFLRDSSYTEFGFHMRVPLWEVPPGEYSLFFAEVAANGTISCSRTVGKVRIVP